MHHKLDTKPTPEKVLYINEPWLIDSSLLNYIQPGINLQESEDNVRVYLPLDLNHEAFIRRINDIIAKYRYASEQNEADFQVEIEQVIAQIEIYDQIYYVREMPKDQKHSTKAIKVIEEVISILQDIPDHCAECFPFELIEELKKEYL